MNYTDLKYDELQVDGKKEYIKYFEDKEEKLYLSCNIIKINDAKKKQKRKFLLTNYAIYNFDSKMKRRIPLKKLRAITINKKNDEFVLHVEDDYDYLYTSEKKNLILEFIRILYKKGNNGKSISFYKKNEESLFNYTTTKSDKKKNVSRIPNEVPIFFDNEDEDRDIELPIRLGTLFTRDNKIIKLEDLKKVKIIGKGSLSEIFLVEKIDSKELFALKTISHEIFNYRKDIMKIFEDMIINHENELFFENLEYAFKKSTNYYFLFKFMRFGDLFFHIQKFRKFSNEKAKFIFCEILLALEKLHNESIIYLDLKPENILIEETNHIRLVDYGYSKINSYLKLFDLDITTIKSDKEDDKNNKIIIGTPEYLSPEIIEGETFSFVSDYWSLGIILYEMLIGIPPFYHRNQELMFDLIKNSELKFPSFITINKDCQDLLKKLLDKNPKTRLGAQNKIEEIKQHPWLSDINWIHFAQKKENKKKYKFN